MNTALVHILLPIIAAILLNALIYAKGWNSQSRAAKSSNMAPKHVNKYLPPGYVIAIVWIVILGLLGYVHYLVYPSVTSLLILLSITYCLAYPFLTSGLQQSKSDFYNVISFILAVAVFMSVYFTKNEYALLCSVPFVLWTSYVNIVT